MATIDQLKPEQLREPEIFERVKELADPFILHIDEKEARFLQEKLESLLEASKLADLQPELYKKYQDLITDLQWTTFSLLPDEDVMEILKKSYLAAMDNEDINILDRIEAKMFSVDLFPRNEIRQKMQKALKENTEQLGSRAFNEWLLDYSKTFDFRDRDELTPSRYVSQNAEAQTLSESEKNKLRKALQIFDKTLLVTPIMSEPAFSMTVREMIKAGTIKERVNPTLLQPPIRTAAPPPAPIEEKPTSPRLARLGREKPSPFEKLLRKPIPPKIEKTPKEITSYEERISPYERKRETGSAKEKEEGYQIRTMKQDIEKAKKQPTQGKPPEPKPKVRDNNIVDLSEK